MDSSAEWSIKKEYRTYEVVPHGFILGKLSMARNSFVQAESSTRDTSVWTDAALDLGRVEGERLGRRTRFDGR